MTNEYYVENPVSAEEMDEHIIFCEYCQREHDENYCPSQND